MKSMMIMILFFFSLTTEAADWSQTDVQILNGKGLKSSPNGDEETKTIWTFEHTSGWKYGSNYFFFDVTDGNKQNETGIYGEFSPFISLTKTASLPTTAWIRDYGIALTAEMPTAPANRANLYGVGIEWNLPGFQYLATNFYIRDDLGALGTSTQWTIVWNVPFLISKASFHFCGFADITSKEDNLEGSVSTQPQLLLDLDQTFGITGVSTGLEYNYWKNKYGLKDWNDGALFYMLKWNL